jgi:hypothetical protein
LNLRRGRSLLGSWLGGGSIRGYTRPVTSCSLSARSPQRYSALDCLVRLLLQPVLDWISARLPDINFPSIPWPDIPLPDIDLPDLALPTWLQVIIGTAKFWLPVLVAIGVAVAEVRRRRAKAVGEGHRDAHR